MNLHPRHTLPAGGRWGRTRISFRRVWLLPPDFLPGARRLAGLPVVRVPGLENPYLGRAVSRAAA